MNVISYSSFYHLYHFNNCNCQMVINNCIILLTNTNFKEEILSLTKLKHLLVFKIIDDVFLKQFNLYKCNNILLLSK